MFAPQAVDITSCGNFAVIGSSCGRVDVYNLQSGLHRGCYGDDEKGVPSDGPLPGLPGPGQVSLSVTPPPLTHSSQGRGARRRHGYAEPADADGRL